MPYLFHIEHLTFDAQFYLNSIPNHSMSQLIYVFDLDEFMIVDKVLILNWVLEHFFYVELGTNTFS